MGLLTDGYQCLIEFTQLPDVPFREKTVTPPQLDSAGVIDITTMRTQLLREKKPKKLLDTGTMSCEIQWDPVIYDTIGNIATRVLGKNGLIRIEFPDGAMINFFGWVASFKPGALKEGEFAGATIDVQCSHRDENDVFRPIAYFKPGDFVDLAGWANIPG